MPGRLPGRHDLSPVLTLIPVGLIVAVVVVDVLSPPDIHLGPLLVAAPAITAAFAGPRLTVAIGVLAVGAQVFIGVTRGVLFTENLQTQIAALVVVSALVVLFTVVRDRNERRLTKSRSVAGVAQQVLLRPLPRYSGTLEIASLYLAAEEEAEMGGDLFAAARTSRSTRLIIGDVRGKGLPAYGQAALLLGAFRAAAHRQATLPNLAIHLDGAVRWDGDQWRADPGRGNADAERGTESAPAEPDAGGDADETFATASLFDIPDRWPVLRTITCGHPPALLLRDGEARTLHIERTALPVGLGGLPGAPEYEVETFPFEPGDLLLLYTDGVIEARDGEGAFYPLAERAVAWSGCSPQQLLRCLREELLTHTGGRLSDDAAAVAVRRLPSRSAPAGPRTTRAVACGPGTSQGR
ncbi:PP2C family protein-serine/threonine phosphatase [Streptomyces sp. NPDC048650]|uniref:PP2C family protein-serine/threonine phosphatase n=1 Tax=unclassified Streptomyces TaxID=2593676 RepID=UPI00371D72BA